MSDEVLTPLQEDERQALVGDRAAILRVVGALREYRALVRQLVGSRYGDGFTELLSTDDDVRRIERVGEGEEDAPNSY